MTASSARCRILIAEDRLALSGAGLLEEWSGDGRAAIA